MPPHDGRALSLCHATVPELTPPEAILVAEATGCGYVSVRLMIDPPGGETCPIMREPALLRETTRRLRETRVWVLDVEVARLDADTRVPAFDPFLRVAAELGASGVLVTGDDAEHARLVDNFGAFCDAASAYGLNADLEFVPWLTVGDLAAAIRVVGAASGRNGGILVDTLHLDRSGGTAGDLAAVPPDWLRYLQVSDACAEKPRTISDMIHIARHERLLPGDGALDLIAMVRKMPPDIPVAIEIPNAKLASGMAALDRVRLAVAAVRSLLAAARET